MKRSIGIFVTGLIIGILAGSEPGDEVRPETETRTITETVEVPVIQYRERLSESCARALDLANQAMDAANIVSATQGEQLQNVSDAQQAIVGSEFYSLSTVTVTQRGITETLTGAYAELANVTDRFNEARKECENG